MIEKILKESGFSEKEVSIYLALFALGSAVVSGIAEKACINRSTAYVVLDALSKRGLVSVVERRGVKIYSAAPPDQLVKNLEGAARHYAELASAAKKSLPKLKTEHAGHDLSRPKVRLFEGAEGMKTVYEDTLASLETIRAGASRGKTRKSFPVSAEQFGSIPAISVYGSKIILVSPEEKFAAVVESRELAVKLKKLLEISRREAEGKKPFLGTEGIAKGIA